MKVEIKLSLDEIKYERYKQFKDDLYEHITIDCGLTERKQSLYAADIVSKNKERAEYAKERLAWLSEIVESRRAVKDAIEKAATIDEIVAAIDLFWSDVYET